MSIAVEPLVGARALVGECPVWDPREGALYWLDIDGLAIHRFDPASGVDESRELARPIGALALRSAGGLVLAAQEGFAVLEGLWGEIVALARLEDTDPGHRMNDGKCDAAGRFWAGTMDADVARRGGSLYRLGSDLRVETVLGGIGCSNGLDWSLDGSLMYYIDSFDKTVDVFEFTPSTGDIGGRRTLIDMPGPRGVGPDGMAVDAEGCLWVARWGGSAVLRYAPDGSPAGEVPLPVTQVSSCAFGGRDLGDLYITTAGRGLDHQQQAEQPLAGTLFRCRPGVAGRPPNQFAG